MPSTLDTHGAVFKQGPAILLARVVGADGAAITQSDISSVTYSILEVDERLPDTHTPVSGHDGVTVPVASCVFDSLQTDNTWSADAEGYNFRHVVNVAVADAFPRAGACYQVRYEITPVVGQKIVFRFHLRSL
ncbi:MAG: hypothetical protein AAGJ46_07780 [Planctomycetota bacterium]